MRLVVDLPAATFETLERLLRTGAVSSINQAIVAAVESYLTLSGAVAREAVADRALGSGVLAQPTLRPHGRFPVSLASAKIGHVAAAAMPEIDAVSGRKYHLFAINRLAPIKVGVRALAVLLSQTDGPMRLSEFNKQAAAMACEIGDWLTSADEDAGRSGSERLSAGFPRSGESADKTQASMERYSFFVLGDVQKKSKIVDGALFRLRLSNVDPSEGGDGIVRVTAPGLEFALLANPVLDGGGQVNGASLSEEEAEWYLAHIAAKVPDEFRTIQLFLQRMEVGARSPAQLLEAVRDEYADLSENAQRNTLSCVLGRLLDLRVVTRIKPREYMMTERGSRFVSQSA
ncbi:MAG TPA: hypothetical protein VM537_18045 [Anaerolineae bacterium]|nr:hypothetical protein [Anaerolineae bacterium]